MSYACLPWAPVVNIFKTCINYIVSYHGLKGNESQLGDLLHKKLYSIDKMTYPNMYQGNSGSSETITNITQIML